MKLRILIVDDEAKSVETLHAELEKLPGIEAVIVGFDKIDEAIEDHAPHIVVLDLARGVPTGEDAPGLEIYELIWKTKFCPLVFYTAVPELLGEDPRLKHPFVRTEKKGSGSEERVINDIRGFERHVSALESVNTEIRGALNRTLKEVAPGVFASVKEPIEAQDMLTRMARRRVAAVMDEKLSTGGPNLRTWEQYLCPPTITGHLLTGDIIRKRAGDSQNPSSYAVILTPSCDLVRDEHRQPKVDKVLAAMCSGVDQLLTEVGLDLTSRREKCKDRLLPLLRQGHGHWCLPVPALPGEFPTMVADFRRLELINISQIGDGETEYVRVASVDNPFRELVAWAYILCAARPGLPDRDFDAWVEEVVLALPEPERKPEQK
jgi:hypothetical protein